MATTEKVGQHAEGCKGEWVELHRIDPEESRPALGTRTVKPDGSVEFKARTNEDGSAVLGRRKYRDKVIVYYCPDCGHKKEESWTD